MCNIRGGVQTAKLQTHINGEVMEYFAVKMIATNVQNCIK